MLRLLSLVRHNIASFVVESCLIPLMSDQMVESFVLARDHIEAILFHASNSQERKP